MSSEFVGFIKIYAIARASKIKENFTIKVCNGFEYEPKQREPI